MPDPTPGEVNFETYWRTLDGLPPFLMTWEQLMPDDRAAWEAAAQAVRDLVRRELVEGFAPRRAEQQAGRAMRDEEETRDA